MSWEKRYSPPDVGLWQGREDLPADACFYQHIQMLNLLKHTPNKTSDIAFGIVGFKCDEGVVRDHGRTGAFEGPIAIRQRFAKLPLQNPNIHIFDAGNITCSDHDLEASQAALASVVNILLENNIRPLLLGGSHDIALGQYQGITAAYKKLNRLGIINFDAHFDLHPPVGQGSAKTVFYQIASSHETEHKKFDYNCIGIQHAANVRQQFEIAKKLNAKIILADELHQGLQEKCFDFVDRVVDENEMLYVSLSLDVFSAAFAPGVATIQPLGLNPWHIIPLIRQVAASNKVVSYDIAEHNPRYDIDHRTAKLAAMLMYEIIHHHNEHQAYNTNSRYKI